MKSNIRKHLLITLTHAEREQRSYYNQKLIVGKVRSIFNCQAIIVAKELHRAKGYHYHAGVLNDSASRHTAARMVRELFPEFEGSQCNVSFHKSWNTICTYVLKQDANPHCWNTTAKECTDRAARQKKGKRTVDSLELLRRCDTWMQVLEHPVLSTQVLRSYSSVKQFWLDLQAQREYPSLEERLRKYLEGQELAKGRSILGYSPEELGDRAMAIRWLGENLDAVRELRKPQLFITGKPMSGKSRFIEELGRFLKLYFVPMRPGDFSGASTTVDLWVLDEFQRERMPESILNSMLDGQQVKLDCKYGNVFCKDKNVPIILIANQVPVFQSQIQNRALSTRIAVTEFLAGSPLEGDRIARTILDQIEARSRLKLESIMLILPTP